MIPEEIHFLTYYYFHKLELLNCLFQSIFCLIFVDKSVVWFRTDRIITKKFKIIYFTEIANEVAKLHITSQLLYQETPHTE